jgi:DNA-binding transcriptional ArsR family regulator
MMWNQRQVGPNRLGDVSRSEPMLAMISPARPKRGETMPRRAAEGIELLADPTRRRIVALIAGRIRHPADIAEALDLSRPATSRQLRLLTEAGLLRRAWSLIDRRSRMYAIDPAAQEAIIAWLAGVDLRNVRPAFSPSWSPPQRVHRLRHDARALGLEHAGFASLEPTRKRRYRTRTPRAPDQRSP